MQFKQLAFSALFSTAVAQGTSLTAALSNNTNLSQLSQLIGASPGLLAALGNATNITILAPSNAAFGAVLNSSAGQALQSQPGAIQALLQYHVLNGTYNSSAITGNSTFIRTLLTNTTFANVTGGQRVEAIRLGGNVSFFSGNFDNSTVSTANITFSGGIIHVINRVLTLPPALGTALINADLRSLYGALNTTGLLNTVAGLSDVTIFAPRNQAIQAVGSAVGNLSMSAISNILSYHVIQGNGSAPYYSNRLTNGTSLRTVQGNNVTIHTNANGTFVNGAKIVTSNYLVAGGVVHIIDSVLNPNNTAFNATQTNGTLAYTGATSVGSDLPFTSGVSTRFTTIGGGAASATSAAGASSTSSRAGAAPARITGAVGAAALFGAGAFVAAL